MSTDCDFQASVLVMFFFSIVTKSASSAKAVQSNLAQITRAHISNPPAFGARIAAAILDDSQLRAQWDWDLVTMSSCIAGMREALYKELEKLGRHSALIVSSGPMTYIIRVSKALPATGSAFWNKRACFASWD